VLSNSNILIYRLVEQWKQTTAAHLLEGESPEYRQGFSVSTFAEWFLSHMESNRKWSSNNGGM
jgi:hypothetical protein